MLSIRLFGSFSVVDADGNAVALTGAKTQGLVAYLALNTEMPPSRDRLMALFWGDRFTEQARQSLRQAIAKLKRTMGDVILTEHDRVGLNPASVSVDVDEFSRLADDPSVETTGKAMALLGGPLLDGLYGQQAEFEDWIASERQRLSSLSMKVMERAAEQAAKAGDAAKAMGIAREIVAMDPLRDASQMVLIRLLAQQGERAAAVQQFNAYEALLEKELGVGPGHELLRLIDEVRGEGFFANEPTHAVPKEQQQPKQPEPTSSGANVAVVPFATLRSEDDLEFFVEGLVEDITINLSRFSWLDVKASVEASGPRLTSADMAKLGKELGLDYVVHGSMRSYGDQIRLTVQLAEPKSARYVWVQRYDRKASDPFQLQDELAETIAASVEAELERIAGRSVREILPEEMNAWDCYHRGLAVQYEFSAETNSQAQKHFRRAIELDPNFGLAYARLSYAMVISAIYFEAEDVTAVLDEALELARVASRLEPEDAVARFALGRVYLARGEYDRSITDLKVAIDLNPGMAQAHCGLGDSLAYSGDLDEAMSCFEEAVRISPADPYRWAFLSYGATALLFQEKFDEAADWAAQAEAVPNAHYWPLAIRASALGHSGRKQEAKQAVAELKRRRPGITRDFVRERLFYLRDEAQVDTYVDGLEKAGLE